MSTAQPHLLDTVDQIDVDWIQSVLHCSGIHGAEVASITSSPIGAGNVSDTVRIAIDYVDPAGDAPTSLVVKFKPSDAAVHAHGLRSGAYHREIGAYVDISERHACRIPLKYWVAGDETTINLVMEDLSSTTTAGNQVVGCGPVEAEAAVVEMARLHSEFFPMTDESAPDWMIRLDAVSEYWSVATEAGANKALQRFATDLPAVSLDAISEATTLVRDWYRLPQRGLTFTHGDPRVDNILFDTSGEQTVAIFIDWQVAGLRNPMYDVGYFMSGSVDVEDRRKHETRLLQRYIEVFSERASDYDLRQATCDYQIQLLSGLFVTLAAIDVLPDNDVVNKLILALLQRNCAAVVDWKSVVALRNVTQALSVS